MKVFVTGGTGFVGSAVVHELRARGIETRALVRSTRKAQRLEALGVEPAYGDVTDADAVLAAMRGCTHTIHLVAIIRGRASEFERVMVGGTRNVIAGARVANVERFVQMSALGVNEQTRSLTPYFAAKWQMEHDVRASGLEHVIVRPSFVFGTSGGVLPTFVRQVRYSPVVPIIGSGKSRFQPVWLDDVAAHLAVALELPAAANRTFELGGPDQVSWDELYRRLARTMGKRRAFVHVPAGLARTGAMLTEWIPGSPLSADQVTMLEDAGDNVVREHDAGAAFGLPRVPLDEQLRRAA
ncbi:MAG TPA: complex I NDUFA9 subunit family protein [Gaiellaceae bacterium]